MFHDAQYSKEELELAAKGPHKGWNPFDIGCEGVRFQHLHNLISTVPFDQAVAELIIEQLKAMALSFGYGEADSLLVFSTGNTYEPLYLSSDENRYFNQVRASEEALHDAAVTPEAKAFLGQPRYGKIYDVLMQSFESGRDKKTEADFENTSQTANQKL